MRDLGSWAVRCTVPLQARLRGAKGDAYRSELEDMRAYALNRPKEESVLPLMNVYRVESWILLAVGALVVMTIFSAARGESEWALTSVMKAGMDGATVLGLICVGMSFMSFWRYVLSSVFRRQLRVRLDDSPDPRLGAIGWLALPNSVDLLPALAFAAIMARELLTYS
jgi:hypothetical protein